MICLLGLIVIVIGDEVISNNIYIKGKYNLRLMLKDVFGFVEHLEKATFDLGYKLALTKNEEDAVLERTAVIADSRIEIDHIHWYVRQYTLSIQQQGTYLNKF